MNEENKILVHEIAELRARNAELEVNINAKKEAFIEEENQMLFAVSKIII